MADGTLAKIVDLRVTAGGSGEELAEELAACLERFLTASADEWTMDRARRALDQWERSVLSGARPPA